AFMPLDPNFPEERLSFLLKDSQAAQLLIEEDLMSFIPPHYEGNMIPIERTESYQSAAPDVPPGDLACLIYTSGTTGRPKGVLVDHHGIANTLQW
ncbi:hypothetical protein C1X64_35810, partial [Pseudomonas sp. GW456-E7]